MSSAIIRATVQSASLNVTSAILAQLLARYQGQGVAAKGTTWNPLGLELTPLLEFLVMSLYLTPLNVLWQQLLEWKWPGYPAPATTSGRRGGGGKKRVKVDDGGRGVTVEHKLSVYNTVAKWVLDQTIGAWVNTALLICSLAVARGYGLEGCQVALSLSFWPIVRDGYKIWPFVSIANFVFVPPARRVVLSAVVGLFWNVYLVLMTSER